MFFSDFKLFEVLINMKFDILLFKNIIYPYYKIEEKNSNSQVLHDDCFLMSSTAH